VTVLLGKTEKRDFYNHFPSHVLTGLRNYEFTAMTVFGRKSEISTPVYLTAAGFFLTALVFRKLQLSDGLLLLRLGH